jgi:hypothetical protein
MAKKRYYKNDMGKKESKLPEDRKTIMMNDYSENLDMYDGSPEDEQRQLDMDRRGLRKNKPNSRF